MYNLKRKIVLLMALVIPALCLQAQKNIEIDDGKLIVKRVNANAEIEVATTDATSDAQIQFGDNGSAIDAILGWDNSEDIFRMTPGSTLTSGGINISGSGTSSKIGLGTDPDANARVFINYNSLDGSPQLFLRENNSGDAARLQFGQFSVTDFWQQEGFAGTDPNFKFIWDDNGTQNEIITLDGDDGDVTVEDGDLMVKKTGGFTTAVEIATGGANSDARLEFGDDGSANDATMGWDGGDDMLKISLGSSLDNGGIIIKNSADERIGLGVLPDDNAKVMINHNSAAGGTPAPQLLLRENNNIDYSRLQFGNFNVADYWHISAFSSTGTDAEMNIFYRDGGVGDNILTIDGDAGRVGVQRDPTANDLEVAGNASKNVAGNWLANSDRRIKTDIREIENSFETMLKLRPVKFKYTEAWKQKNPSIKDQYYYNFIAQDYQEIFPESVKGSGEYLEGDKEEILQVDTYNAQIVNMVATQELIKENMALKKEIESLKASMTSMASNHELLFNELRSIKTTLDNQAGRTSDDD